jgi:pimeloyl-ACP methyl ester carboxylesterase
MKTYRLWGNTPYKIAVIHGGPGAAGSMAPVARELCRDAGIFEPFQTETTLEGQVRELSGSLKAHADLPATLIGHSWGAWLAFLAAVSLNL